MDTPAPVLTRRVPEVVEKGTPAYVLVVRVPAGCLVEWVPVRDVKRDPDAVEHGVPVKVNELVYFVKVNAWRESVNLNENG